MSDTLTVPTHFAEISEFAEGFVDRVDEERLILYGPESYEEGAEIPFAVLLVDGSPALQGTARVAASVDGGEERTPETRYDIVLESVQLDGHSEVVYERVLISRNSALHGAPETGEVNLDDVEHIEEGGPEELQDESTVVGEQRAESAPETMDAPAAVGEPAAGEAELAAEPAMPVAEGEAAAEPAFEPEPAFDEPPQEHPEQAASQFEMGETIGAGVEAGGWEEPPAEPLGSDAAAQAMEPAEAGDPWADRGTGDVGLEDVQEVGPGDEVFAEATAAGAAPESGQPVAPVASPAEAPPDKPPPEPPRAPGSFDVGGVGTNGSALSRPSYERSWVPVAGPPVEPEPSSGLFAHTGGLPIPPRAPRPDLDPSLRVSPAPHPGTEGAPSEAGAEPAAPMEEPYAVADMQDGGETFGAAPGSEPPAEDLTDAMEVGELGELQDAGDEAVGEATHAHVEWPEDESDGGDRER